ncbi:MAG TPA: preprotein translocase subunit YajC [Acidimicrobiales bacterium]|nr:preprotein translocase subunit YajC [Acidimicrobiales bacterium]
MLFAVNMLMATTKKTSSFSPVLIILYVVVFGSLYFFYIRPRSQKQKAARMETRKVELGERAQTIGGFVGTVVKMDDGLITLRGANGVELDFIPTAIARKYNPPAAVPESSDDEHEEEGDQK